MCYFSLQINITILTNYNHIQTKFRAKGKEIQAKNSKSRIFAVIDSFSECFVLIICH